MPSCPTYIAHTSGSSNTDLIVLILQMSGGVRSGSICVGSWVSKTVVTSIVGRI